MSYEIPIPSHYPIGKQAMVRDLKHEPHDIVGAKVIDKYPNSKNAKRVRLYTGEHSGDVLMLPGEAEIIEFV